MVCIILKIGPNCTIKCVAIALRSGSSLHIQNAIRNTAHLFILKWPNIVLQEIDYF